MSFEFKVLCIWECDGSECRSFSPRFAWTAGPAWRLVVVLASLDLSEWPRNTLWVTILAVIVFALVPTLVAPSQSCFWFRPLSLSFPHSIVPDLIIKLGATLTVPSLLTLPLSFLLKRYAWNSYFFTIYFFLSFSTLWVNRLLPPGSRTK